MVRNYAEMFYSPASKRWDELVGNDMAMAKQLAGWKRKLRDNFGAIRIASIKDDMPAEGGAAVGKNIHVEAVIDLGSLSGEDVLVELYYGPLDDDGQLSDGKALAMTLVGPDGDRRIKFAAEMPCDRSGMTGYTVRVMPRHPMLPDARDMAMIKWA
jgi:starch phosphorylase